MFKKVTGLFVPTDGVFLLRYSDNVLLDEDYSVFKITTVCGFVVEATTVYQGVYSLCGFSTSEQIQRSIDLDPTGQYPETYREIVQFSDMKERYYPNDIGHVLKPIPEKEYPPVMPCDCGGVCVYCDPDPIQDGSMDLPF